MNQYNYFKNSFCSLLDIEAIDFHKFDKSKTYQTIIYIGSLYAFGIKGLTHALGKMNSFQYSHLLVATVSLSDQKVPVNKEKRTENIRYSSY